MACNGVALDPSKCSKLSMDEKRELVYELSKRTSRASEMLQSWSRQEILQILCAEMGKERKYTGLTKLKIIENLLKIVAEKNSGDHESVMDPEMQSSLTIGQRTAKRQRKADHPCRLPVPVNDFATNNGGDDMTNAIYCKNSACKASLRQEDTFCKRCSCCICYKFDDNKDPSLWLICSSEPPFQGNSCGMSCHLECALKHEKSGFLKDKRHAGLDGIFYCVPCGKVNDLLGCWRKQLMAAKDTRRVDILCYRVSLGQKLLNGTQKYQKLSEIINEAVKKLEAEVGPLTGVPVKMGRGIVNRLSSGPEVQKLCSSAVELLDKMIFDMISNSLPGSIPKLPSIIRFEDVRPTSVTVIVGSEETLPGVNVGYTLCYRKVHDMEYPEKPISTMLVPNMSDQNDDRADNYLTYCKDTDKIVSTNLCEGGPNTGEVSLLGMDRAIVGPLPDSDVVNVEKKHTLDDPITEDTSTDNGSDALVQIGTECVPFVGCSEAALPVTPCRMEIVKDGQGRSGRSKTSNKDLENQTGNAEDHQDGSSSKKRSGERRDEECVENGLSEMDFEHCVKVIRWLECEGHIEKNFRQKFLTWYSLRATTQEVRVVKVFIDILNADPASLAEQLVDTFSDCISSKKSSVVPAGLCMKLWH
ncbi:hypothetical protein GOBAR_DD15018 [Gossypium barbadense]|nr:hypothetical protein GOBAR_DD15018 [Gossypium barbadense]